VYLVPATVASGVTATALATALQMWDDPTMAVSTLDSKKRLVLPEGTPGDVFDIRKEDDGRYVLVRLERPEPRTRKDRKACLAAMKRAPLRPTMSWDQIRKLTREP
jgi:hypothetical protein